MPARRLEAVGSLGALRRVPQFLDRYVCAACKGLLGLTPTRNHISTARSADLILLVLRWMAWGRVMSETRKITAILVADVVGYSRLAGAGRCAAPEPGESSLLVRSR